ncbi:hypothetical protein SeMB42_g00628 [Synchytrium endobioticum]|uniref:Uncharacterized protein n=1 Tax=Synchytrium endobioticum TaxID=286115 RepID=A0A507DR15_9FUNG|nr:hypothetical protein SeLEV6574_g07967 [Synchytrium endobioticum]TPX53667.1 hypothetical protein SeMB42_g00628 [Synchytrium endobioticum]
MSPSLRTTIDALLDELERTIDHLSECTTDKDTTSSLKRSDGASKGSLPSLLAGQNEPKPDAAPSHNLSTSTPQLIDPEALEIESPPSQRTARSRRASNVKITYNDVPVDSHRARLTAHKLTAVLGSVPEAILKAAAEGLPVDAPNRERGVKTGNIDKAWRILGIHTKSRDVVHDDEDEQDAHAVAAPIINVNDGKMDYNEDGAASGNNIHRDVATTSLNIEFTQGQRRKSISFTVQDCVQDCVLSQKIRDECIQELFALSEAFNNTGLSRRDTIVRQQCDSSSPIGGIDVSSEGTDNTTEEDTSASHNTLFPTEEKPYQSKIVILRPLQVEGVNLGIIPSISALSATSPPVLSPGSSPLEVILPHFRAKILLRRSKPESGNSSSPSLFSM